MRDARGAEGRAGVAFPEHVLAREHADALVAVDPDAIAVEELLPVGDLLLELVAEALRHGEGLVGEVEREAADARVGDGEARARDLVEDGVDLLAVLERPQEDRQRAGVHHHRAGPQEVAGDAGELTADGPEPLGALGGLDAGQLLDREAPRHVVRVGRHVVHAVRVGHELLVGLHLGQLLDAAVQVPDVEQALLDGLAVELADDAEGAVRGRVLRAQVQDHLRLQRVVRDHRDRAGRGHLGPVAAEVDTLLGVRLGLDLDLRVAVRQRAVERGVMARPEREEVLGRAGGRGVGVGCGLVGDCHCECWVEGGG